MGLLFCGLPQCEENHPVATAPGSDRAASRRGKPLRSAMGQSPFVLLHTAALMDRKYRLVAVGIFPDDILPVPVGDDADRISVSDVSVENTREQDPQNFQCVTRVSPNYSQAKSILIIQDSYGEMSNLLSQPQNHVPSPSPSVTTFPGVNLRTVAELVSIFVGLLRLFVVKFQSCNFHLSQGF